jgi:3-oxoacyl-[acyl-carrier-protein] synthase II
LGLCSDRIQSGHWQNALVISIDLITAPILLGLKMLGALTLDSSVPPAQCSRPFSASRSGFVRCEAAGALLLENSRSVEQRQMKKYCQVLGYGQAADSEHITAGHKESYGIELSIQNALANARVKSEEVDLIKAHGTGTLVNDRNEAAAISRIFGSQTPVISFKGQFGHAASSSGIFEAILCQIIFEENTVFESLNCEDPDDLKINVLRKPRQADAIKKILLNAFGFGGHNCSLVIQRVTSSIGP